MRLLNIGDSAKDHLGGPGDGRFTARGTLLVNGQWSSSRPFDIAPNRAFAYDGHLFIEEKLPGLDARLNTERLRLAAVLNDAWRDDQQVQSSPCMRNFLVSRWWTGAEFGPQEPNISAAYRTTGWSA